jgi:hypothetical protein
MQSTSPPPSTQQPEPFADLAERAVGGPVDVDRTRRRPRRAGGRARPARPAARRPRGIRAELRPVVAGPGDVVEDRLGRRVQPQLGMSTLFQRIGTVPIERSPAAADRQAPEPGAPPRRRRPAATRPSLLLLLGPSGQPAGVHHRGDTAGSARPTSRSCPVPRCEIAVRPSRGRGTARPRPAARRTAGSTSPGVRAASLWIPNAAPIARKVGGSRSSRRGVTKSVHAVRPKKAPAGRP